MKKKKKYLFVNNINFYNINEKIINIEDKFNYQIKIFQNNVNLNLLIEENYNILFNKLTFNQKKYFNFLNKILESKSDIKYNFIRFYNNNINVIQQFNKKVNLYQNAFNNLVDNNINHKYFINLIKDDKCIPFWNDNIKEKSKNIFLPIKENLKEIALPNTFNYSNWFLTKHYNNNNPNKDIHDIIIKKERQFNNTYIDKKTGKIKNIIKCRKVNMYLNLEQQKYLKRLFGAYRYYYNRAIQYINNYDKISKKTFFYVNYLDKTSIQNINLEDEKNIFTLITMRKYLKKINLNG